MSRSRRTTLLCVSLLVSSCARGGETDIVPAFDYQSLIMRPQSYGEDTATIERAVERAVARCVAREGALYKPVYDFVDRLNGSVDTNLAERRRTGYGWAARRRMASGDRRSAQLRNRRVREAFYGVKGRMIPFTGVQVSTPIGPVTTSPKGCLSAARKEVGGTLHRYLDATTAAEGFAYVALMESAKEPAWKRVNAKWARCMERTGHPYSAPNKAMAAMARVAAEAKVVDDDLLRREVEVAVADGRCQIEVGMPAVDRRLRRSYLAGLSATERRGIRHIARIRAEVLARARTMR